MKNDLRFVVRCGEQEGKIRTNAIKKGNIMAGWTAHNVSVHKTASRAHRKMMEIKTNWTKYREAESESYENVRDWSTRRKICRKFANENGLCELRMIEKWKPIRSHVHWNSRMRAVFVVADRIKWINKTKLKASVHVCQQNTARFSHMNTQRQTGKFFFCCFIIAMLAFWRYFIRKIRIVFVQSSCAFHK